MTGFLVIHRTKKFGDRNIYKLSINLSQNIKNKWATWIIYLFTNHFEISLKISLTPKKNDNTEFCKKVERILRFKSNKKVQFMNKKKSLGKVCNT